MYQFLVKRHVRKQFDRLSVGDYESVLAAIPAGGPDLSKTQHPVRPTTFTRDR